MPAAWGLKTTFSSSRSGWSGGGGSRTQRVQSGPGEVARTQSVQQGVLVDQAAPRSVDEHRAGLHRPECTRVHQVLSVVCQWSVKADRVRSTQAAVQVFDQLTAGIGGLRFGYVRIQHQHLHSEGLRPRRQLPADAPESDEEERGPVQIKRFHRVSLTPAVLPHKPIHGYRLLPQREEERHRVFRNGNRICGGRYR